MFHLHSSRKKPETSKNRKKEKKKPPVKTASVSSDLHVVIGVTEKGQGEGCELLLDGGVEDVTLYNEERSQGHRLLQGLPLRVFPKGKQPPARLQWMAAGR